MVIDGSGGEESVVLRELRVGEVVGVVLVDGRHDDLVKVGRRRFNGAGSQRGAEVDRVAIVDARGFVLRARCHAHGGHGNEKQFLFHFKKYKRVKQ